MNKISILYIILLFSLIFVGCSPTIDFDAESDLLTNNRSVNVMIIPPENMDSPIYSLSEYITIPPNAIVKPKSFSMQTPLRSTADFIRNAANSAMPAYNQINTKVIDMGYFTIYLYHETIHDSITSDVAFNNFSTQLDEVNELLTNVLDRAFGDEYKLQKLHEFIKKELKPKLQTAYVRFFNENRQANFDASFLRFVIDEMQALGYSKNEFDESAVKEWCNSILSKLALPKHNNIKPLSTKLFSKNQTREILQSALMKEHVGIGQLLSEYENKLTLSFGSFLPAETKTFIRHAFVNFRFRAKMPGCIISHNGVMNDSVISWEFTGRDIALSSKRLFAASIVLKDDFKHYKDRFKEDLIELFTDSSEKVKQDVLAFLQEAKYEKSVDSVSQYSNLLIY